MKTTIALASDHAGFERKREIIDFLRKKGYKIEDLGPFDESRVSYTVYGKKLAHHLLKNPDNIGIAICGTGLGMSYALNRFKHIRAARVTSVNDAYLAKAHNNANALALSARFSTNVDNFAFIEEFLKSEYEGGRHQERIDELDK